MFFAFLSDERPFLNDYQPVYPRSVAARKKIHNFLSLISVLALISGLLLAYKLHARLTRRLQPQCLAICIH